MVEQRRSFRFVALLIGTMSFVGCGVSQSHLTYTEAQPVNQPVKTKGCYDAAILLAKDLPQSKEMSKRVLVALDSTIDKETATQIKAQRNRHIGVFVGSGGEELIVNLKVVAPNQTFVTATTATGFVGGAGQVAWSCKFVDELKAMAVK